MTYEEIYEQFFNSSGLKPYTSVVKLEDAYEYYHYKWWQSYYRNLFRFWLTPEFMTTEAQDLIVNPDNKGFEDLHIKPVSFGKKVPEYVQDIIWLNNIQESTKREGANNWLVKYRRYTLLYSYLNNKLLNKLRSTLQILYNLILSQYLLEIYR